jgi:hypothetical protein
MQAWEAEAKPGNGGAGSEKKARGAASKAVHAWERAGQKGRAALKKLNIERVHELESSVSDFIASVSSHRSDFLGLSL